MSKKKKIIVEIEFDDSWEEYIPDDNEKLNALFKAGTTGYSAKIVEKDLDK